MIKALITSLSPLEIPCLIWPKIAFYLFYTGVLHQCLRDISQLINILSFSLILLSPKSNCRNCVYFFKCLTFYLYYWISSWTFSISFKWKAPVCSYPLVFYQSVEWMRLLCLHAPLLSKNCVFCLALATQWRPSASFPCALCSSHSAVEIPFPIAVVQELHPWWIRNTWIAMKGEPCSLVLLLRSWKLLGNISLHLNVITYI